MIAKSHSFIYFFFFPLCQTGDDMATCLATSVVNRVRMGICGIERGRQKGVASGVCVLSENWTVQCKRSRVTHLAHITFPTTGKKSHVNPIGITFTCVLKY